MSAGTLCDASACITVRGADDDADGDVEDDEGEDGETTVD